MFLLSGELYAGSPVRERTKNIKAHEFVVKSMFKEDSPRERSITNTFFESLTQELVENKDLLVCYDESGYITAPESGKNYFDIYGYEMRERSFIWNDIIARSLAHSLGEAFNQTPVGMEIKRLEDEVSRYFVTEYSKRESDKKATFYLPGEMSVEEMNAKKQFRISFSSSVYAEASSLKEDLSLEVEANFPNTEIYVFYNILRRGFGFNLKTERLKPYLGTDFSFFSTHYEDEDESNIGFLVTMILIN